jgi:hypothetical protein
VFYLVFYLRRQLKGQMGKLKEELQGYQQSARDAQASAARVTA